jgi:hypothetical protein
MTWIHQHAWQVEHRTDGIWFFCVCGVYRNAGTIS